MHYKFDNSKYEWGDDMIGKILKKFKVTENIHIKRINIIRDAAIIGGGIILGSLGFIAGPIIGAATLTTGVCASSGLVYTTHKLEK